MRQIPDDPIIRAMERYGVPPYLADAKEPICPLCGSECQTIYKADGEIVGCDNCVDSFDAYDEEACFPERGREW